MLLALTQFGTGCSTIPPEIDQIQQTVVADFRYIADLPSPGLREGGLIYGNCQVFTGEALRLAREAGLQAGAAMGPDHVEALIYDRQGRAWLLGTKNVLPRLAWR